MASTWQVNNHTCTCIQTQIEVNNHVPANIHYLTWTHAHTCTHTHIHMHTPVHTHMHTHTHTHTHKHSCTHAHTYTHVTHTHALTHILTRLTIKGTQTNCTDTCYRTQVTISEAENFSNRQTLDITSNEQDSTMYKQTTFPPL